MKYLIGLGSGLIGGLIGGLFGRFLTSSKMALNCNSLYKNYIPLKFREENNIPDCKFRHYNPNTVDFMLYSIKKEKITKEEWEDQKKNKELIIDVAILEVDNL